MNKKPWLDEPDRLDFEAHGYECKIVRQDHSGHLCGYVRLPAGHPWRYMDGERGDFGQVHGGITYQGERPGGPLGAEYWVGFDCAHSGDLSHFVNGLPQIEGEVYRDIGYVARECVRLARQAAEAYKPQTIRARAVEVLGKEAVRILEECAAKAARGQG